MQNREFELIDGLRILWRQKWIIIVTFVAAIIAAWSSSRAFGPTYQIETSVLLLPSLSSELGAEPVGSRLSPEAYEELAVSTPLLRIVSDSLPETANVSVEDLKSWLSVSAKRLGSEFLLTASIIGSEPDTLRGIALSWIDAFVEAYSELFQDRVARSFTYVRTNHEETEAELAVLLEERTAFLSENVISLLEAEAEVLQELLAEASMSLMIAQQEARSVEAYLAARSQRSPTSDPTLVLTSDLDPNTLMGALVFGFSPEEFREIVESRIMDLEQSIVGIETELMEKLQQIDVAEAAQSEYDRRIELLQSGLAMLSAKLQEAKLALAETPEPIRVIDEPLLPPRILTIKKTTSISVAGFLGLVVGTLLAFLVDYLARVHERENLARSEASSSPEGSGHSKLPRLQDSDHELPAGNEKPEK